MILPITYPAQTEFLRPELYIALVTLSHEALTYPLDRIAVRTMARTHNKSPVQALNYQECRVVAHEILAAEGRTGLYHGLRAALDRNVSKQCIRYFAFHYLYYLVAYRDLVAPGYRSELDVDVEYSPEHPEFYPLLKYVEFTSLRVHAVAFVANALGVLASQPINVLKVKLQCEPLGNTHSMYTRL